MHGIFLSGVFCHEVSKALRNTKDWCGGFATNARMNCSPLPLGEGLGVPAVAGERLFLPRRLEGTKKHEGLVRKFCHECTNVRMVLVLKTLQHLVYQLHIKLYASNNHLLIYLLYQSLQNFSWTTFCKFCSSVTDHRLNALCPSNRPRELCN